MLKKLNAMPYTSIDNMNSHSPLPGLPIPNNRNLRLHAIRERNITLLNPIFFIATPTSRMQAAYEICDREKSSVAFPAAGEPAYSSNPMKWFINGMAYPFEI